MLLVVMSFTTAWLEEAKPDCFSGGCAGHVKVMACDEWAHTVLMAALDHTDDTALLRKSIVPELLVRPSGQYFTI